MLGFDEHEKKARVGIIIDGGNVSTKSLSFSSNQRQQKIMKFHAIIQEQITAERSAGWLFNQNFF